jgi:hypothetical protein
MKTILTSVLLLIGTISFSQAQKSKGIGVFEYTGDLVMSTTPHGVGTGRYTSDYSIVNDTVNKKIIVTHAKDGHFLINVTHKEKYELGYMYDGTTYRDNQLCTCVVLMNEGNVAVYVNGSAYYYFHGKYSKWNKEVKVVK